MKFDQLKKFQQQHKISQSDLAGLFSSVGLKVSQPKMHRWLSLPGEEIMPPDIERAFKLVKKKWTSGLYDRKINPQKGDLNFPGSELSQLPADLISDSKVVLRGKSEFETVRRISEAGSDRESAEKVEKNFKNYLLVWISRIKFANDAVALYLYFLDMKSKGNFVKAAPVIGALLYFISPIDLIPDYLPLAGFVDDAGVIAAVIGYLKGEIEPYSEKAEKTIKAWQSN